MREIPLTSLFYLILILGLSMQSSMSVAQTWNGSVSSDWNNASNWDGGLPGASSNVVITNQTNKPILNTSTTVASVQIGSYWPGPGITTLTVIGGGSLTITNSLTFNGAGGSLHIDGGDVNLTGSTFSQGSNSRYIEMTSGSFTSSANVTINGGDNPTPPGFSVGAGTATFNGNLIVSNSGTGKVFDAGSGNVTVAGTFEVQGSSGVFNLGSGTLEVDNTATIKGTFNGGTGTSTFNNDLSVSNGAYFYVDDGILNITGNANFTQNGNLSVDTGTINIGGNASISNGGEMNFNSGNFNVAGNATFSGGSSVNAGGATVSFGGDVTVDGSENFNSDSSTVVFNGTGNQTLNVGSGGTGDITFNNVVVDSGAVVITDGGDDNAIIIEGDLTVDEDGGVEVSEDDQLDVQGEVTGGGAGNVSSPSPYSVSAAATNSTTVVITFNKEMVEATAENTANYSIARVSNPATTLTVTSATLNTGGNSKQVTLVVSTITDDVQYEITMNPSGTMESVDGGKLTTNHKKKFTKVGPITFYSITSGNWASNSTWSRISHSGAVATSNPSNTSGATVIVGDSDVVTIASSTSIAGQTSVTVTGASSKLVVGSGGTLTTGTKTVTGTGIFEVTTGTLQIGSTAGIAASGATGNIQTTTRTFSTSGNYTYNGSSAQITGTGLPSTVANLTINNSAGVTINADIEVTGTLTLSNGSFTIESGNNLIANTKSIASGDLIMKHNITGSLGWRLLSSPIDTDYDDFLDGITTQGYTGSTLGNAAIDSLQPNVLYYDETYPGTDNQRWRAPASAATSITEGQGLFTFIFGDIASDARYNNTFPRTLTAQGQENGGPVDLGVSYTVEADSGWNLVGNPYAASIDWDDSGNWTKTNIDETIYIWDYTTNQFKTWNGTTGDLPNGKISPFQGFWVKANDEDPFLIVNEDAKATGGVFVGKANSSNPIPKFSLSLVNGGQSVSTHFMFSENAKLGKDPMDGYLLLPFSGISDYTELSSISENGDQFAINNLPRKFGIPIEIPLHVESYKNGFSTSSSMYFKFEDFSNIPNGWSIFLVDKNTGTEVDMLNQRTHIISLAANKGKIATNASASSKPKLREKSNGESARFVIRIEPGEDAFDIPNKLDLSQNYPNPFNPSTKIQFSLPVQSMVELSIFDILGRKITTLVNQELEARTHTFEWNATNMSSGLYLYRLVTSQGVVTKKMTLIK